MLEVQISFHWEETKIRSIRNGAGNYVQSNVVRSLRAVSSKRRALYQGPFVPAASTKVRGIGARESIRAARKGLFAEDRSPALNYIKITYLSPETAYLIGATWAAELHRAALWRLLFVSSKEWGIFFFNGVNGKQASGSLTYLSDIHW